MTLQLELNKNLESKLQKISKERNCSLEQYLENSFNEYIEQVLDKQLIEKMESDENTHGINYYTTSEALQIMDKIDNNEISDKDILDL